MRNTRLEDVKNTLLQLSTTDIQDDDSIVRTLRVVTPELIKSLEFVDSKIIKYKAENFAYMQALSRPINIYNNGGQIMNDDQISQMDIDELRTLQHKIEDLIGEKTAEQGTDDDAQKAPTNQEFQDEQKSRSETENMDSPERTAGAE